MTMTMVNNIARVIQRRGPHTTVSFTLHLNPSRYVTETTHSAQTEIPVLPLKPPSTQRSST